MNDVIERKSYFWIYIMLQVKDFMPKILVCENRKMDCFIINFRQHSSVTLWLCLSFRLFFPIVEILDFSWPSIPYCIELLSLPFPLLLTQKGIVISCQNILFVFHISVDEFSFEDIKIPFCTSKCFSEKEAVFVFLLVLNCYPFVLLWVKFFFK